MSINLHCKQVNLIQTPTYITELIYSNGDGGWRGIRYRYECWILNSIQEINNDQILSQDYKRDYSIMIKNHIKELHQHKTLSFGTG